MTAAFGRAETVAVGAVELSILLVKNPAGANEILRTLALEPGPLDVLAILNDRTADGRDVSWVWDADFELLAGRGAPRHLLGHARRGAGAAAQVRRGRGAALHVAPALERGARQAARRRSPGRLFALPTYTALLELHELLASRGHVLNYWAEPAGARR